jgi:tetratricopeptide (TPR) repeat protein
MEQMLSDPPFTTQSIHSNQMQEVSAELNRLHRAGQPAAIRGGLREVQAAMARQPGDADLMSVLASLLEAAGDDQAAEQRWREAVALTPQAPIPYLHLAKLLRREGREEEAGKAYEECLRRDLDNYEAHGDLGALRSQQGRPAEAIPHLRALVRQQPQSVNGHYVLGQALLQTKQRKEALAEFSEVLTRDPGNKEAKQMVVRLSGPE